jgi:hypothetical protein
MYSILALVGVFAFGILVDLAIARRLELLEERHTRSQERVVDLEDAVYDLKRRIDDELALADAVDELKRRIDAQ